MKRDVKVHGRVEPSFEPVRRVFRENFTERGELGASCCVYLRGKKVVDLWGGSRDRTSGEPWRADTMTIVHSTSKGLAAMVMALAHSRGWIDYDERVATYWPEFARNGKESITIRQLLAHQAGLFAFDEPVDRDVIADPDRLARIMERQRPAWPPGERQAYHAITLGFYEGEIIRRVDPAHRTLGRVFDDEIAKPLGIDVYLRVPASLPDLRLAPLEPPGTWEMLTHMSPAMTLAVVRPHSVLHRSLVANPGTRFYLDPERVVVRELEAPSGCGVGSARGIAHAYGVFAHSGAELGLRRATLDALAAPARPSRNGFHDDLFDADAKFSLGFMKPSASFEFGSPSSFGAPGAGGSIGYADPEAGIGYAYVTNTMGMELRGDPRDVALREALASVMSPSADRVTAPGTASASLEAGGSPS
jgi:CubicO group peptidase (beta-lactamase class C family)